MTYSITQIAKILKLSTPIIHDYKISILLTDSRSLSIPQESLFFALSTPKNDGHRYIDELYQRGVRNFVIEQSYPLRSELAQANMLRVKSPLEALQQLAKDKRNQVEIPIIGITGSNGKTVVKEWLFQLLNHSKVITRSPRSYNSQIGVPLSVWMLKENTEIGIFEAGISKPDEMQRLAQIIRPTIGIFTNLGACHQENFFHYRQKADEKLKLFQNCDLLIYNADDPIIGAAIELGCYSFTEIGWSRKNINSPVYIASTTSKNMRTRINYEYLGMANSIKIPFVDEASIENAIHCLATLLYLGFSPNVIEERMLQLEPVAMRMELLEGSRENIIINDTYNSDVSSLDIALDFQKRRKTTGLKQTLILSDILESGQNATTLYRKVADLCQNKGIEQLIGIGEKLYTHQDLFKNTSAIFFKTTQELISSNLLDKLERNVILVKGARSFHFEDITDVLTRKQHQTILEVNLDAVLYNYSQYKQLLKPSTQLVAMIKADGYGAGAIEIAQALQSQGADYFAVALADEGVALIENGIHTPIMIMNPEVSCFNKIFKHHLEPEVYSLSLLKNMLQYAHAIGVNYFPIHLKINTGMNRLGFDPHEIDEVIELLKNDNALIIKSVFSHLAASDNPELDEFTHEQIKTFTQVAAQISEQFDHPIARHILNSAGIERFNEYEFEMARLGIGLYGIQATNTQMHLYTVAELKSTLLQIKNISPTQTVGYGRNGVIQTATRIGIVPIGYADGFNRHLGNGVGEVLINGYRCPTIGNVCMDTIMVNLKDYPIKEGDPVIIFGKDLPVEEIAQKLDTIPYEIITSPSARIKRVYYRE